jgi:hypothetical protein
VTKKFWSIRKIIKIPLALTGVSTRRSLKMLWKDKKITKILHTVWIWKPGIQIPLTLDNRTNWMYYLNARAIKLPRNLFGRSFASRLLVRNLIGHLNSRPVMEWQMTVRTKWRLLLLSSSCGWYSNGPEFKCTGFSITNHCNIGLVRYSDPRLIFSPQYLLVPVQKVSSIKSLGWELEIWYRKNSRRFIFIGAIQPLY